MTLARQIIPGSIYLITRRCSERRYFLTPGKSVNSLVGYLLATHLNLHKMELLGAVQMSNHYHLIVHDTAGNLPNFLRDFNALTARAVNRLRGRVDGFWDIRQPGVTELCDADAVMKSLVYVACNPVRAGLVREGKHWPGLRTAPLAASQRPHEHERPSGFFRKGGPLPERALLEVHVPPTHRHLTADAFTKELQARVKVREAEIQREMDRAGRRFGRARDALITRWNDAPTSDNESGTLVPRIAASTTARRRSLLVRLREFLGAHAEARGRFCAGLLETVFPGGTWRMTRVFGLAAYPPPVPAWRALC